MQIIRVARERINKIYHARIEARMGLQSWEHVAHVPA